MRTRAKTCEDLLGPSELKGAALWFCTEEEKLFLAGVEAIKDEMYVRAFSFFEQAVRLEPKFYDAQFCSAALLLKHGQAEASKTRLLKLLSHCPDFFGVFTARFMPGFRLMLEIREGYHHRIKPVASDVATTIGVLCMRGREYIEAKKVFQQVINSDPGNQLARVLLAESLLCTNNPKEAAKLVYQQIPDLSSPLGAISFNIRGKAVLAIGDIHTGLLLLEGASDFPFKGEKALRDTLILDAARAFEDREYFQDTLEFLERVTDQERIYRDGETVSFARLMLADRIMKLARCGVKSTFKLSRPPRKQTFRREDYWELGING